MVSVVWRLFPILVSGATLAFRVFRSEQKNGTAHLRIEIVVQTLAWASLANPNVRKRPRRRGGAALAYCIAVAFEESDVEVNLMRVFWEKVGVLGPVYRLVGKGLSDREIATKLNLTELSVQTCIAWISHFLGLANRNELIRYAAPPLVREAAIVDAPLQLRMAANLSL
jgi:hypothetical protein